jgi:hypothetical protein
MLAALKYNKMNLQISQDIFLLIEPLLLKVVLNAPLLPAELDVLAVPDGAPWLPLLPRQFVHEFCNGKRQDARHGVAVSECADLAVIRQCRVTIPRDPQHLDAPQLVDAAVRVTELALVLFHLFLFSHFNLQISQDFFYSVRGLLKFLTYSASFGRSAIQLLRCQ